MLVLFVWRTIAGYGGQTHEYTADPNRAQYILFSDSNEGKPENDGSSIKIGSKLECMKMR